MRILQIHKYFSKKRGGGSVTAFFEIIKMLEKHKHKIGVFSMQDKNNLKNKSEKYFTPFFDLNQKMSFIDKIKIVPKIIYNVEAQKKLQELIDNEKPEIAHIHNIYHYLSLSIVDTFKKNKIPMIITLHDYKAICPNYK
jgi:glycosyltransferase involved in cell wall biosynthesis